MHLTSEDTPPSFCCTQCSHLLLELMLNLQFWRLETSPALHEKIVFMVRFQCGVFSTEFIGFEIHCSVKRDFTSPGVFSFEGFHPGTSMCSFFHSAYSVNCTFQYKINWATIFFFLRSLTWKTGTNTINYTAKAFVTLLNKHISYLVESVGGSILVELKCWLETMVWYERIQGCNLGKTRTNATSGGWLCSLYLFLSSMRYVSCPFS